MLSTCHHVSNCRDIWGVGTKGPLVLSKDSGAEYKDRAKDRRRCRAWVQCHHLCFPIREQLWRLVDELDLLGVAICKTQLGEKELVRLRCSVTTCPGDAANAGLFAAGRFTLAMRKPIKLVLGDVLSNYYYSWPVPSLFVPDTCWRLAEKEKRKGQLVTADLKIARESGRSCPGWLPWSIPRSASRRIVNFPE